MSEFTIDGKKLTVADDVDGEVWLRGTDVVEILKSSKRDSEELQEWISEQVLPYSNVNKSIENPSLYTSKVVLKLKEEIHRQNEEIDRNNEEIKLNQKAISKLRQSLALLQQQLFQTVGKNIDSDMPNTENINLFFLVKKNLKKIESIMDYFPYYVMRAKKRFAKERLDHLKSKYPLCEILLEVEDPPNVDLFNQITELKNVRSCDNHLETSLTEEELISLFVNLKLTKQQ